MIMRKYTRMDIVGITERLFSFYNLYLVKFSYFVK